MVVKYLHATLSALAKKLPPLLAIDISDYNETLYKDSVNYLNASHVLRRFPRRKRWTIELLPKSIIMSMILVIACFFFSAKALAQRTVTNFTIGAQSTTPTYGTASNPTSSFTLTLTRGGTNATGSCTISFTWTGATPTGAVVTFNPASPYNPNLVTTVAVKITTTATSPAGSYPFSIKNVDANGGGTVTQTGTFVINKKNVTITATGVSKLYGNTLTGGAGSTAFTTSGMANGETIGSVSIAYGTASAATTVPGSYTGQVTPSLATGGTFTASNYNFSYTSGTITVTAPTISYPSTTYTYATGYAITAVTATVTGTPTGYSISPGLPAGLSFNNGTISGSPTATSTLTTYTVTATYSGGVTATTTIKIQVSNTVTLTITATNVTQTYGSVTPSVTFTYSGWINGDNPSKMSVIPSISTTATSTSPAGTYPITVGGGTAPAYYTVVYVQGTFTINKAALIIAATGPAIAVNQTVNSGYNTANFTVNGLISGDSVDSVYLAVNNPNGNTTGSSYTITPSGAMGTGISNYTITYTPYGGTIGQNYTWTGATNSTWSTSTNWSPNGVPGVNDNAIIPTGTTNTPDITASTNVNTISFTAASPTTTFLTIEGDVNVLFYNGFTINKNVKLTINMATTTSQITVGTASSRALMDNLGTTTINGGIVYITFGLNYIYNEASGTIYFQGGNTLDIDGTSGQLAMENSGFMFIGTSNSACSLNIVHSQSVINQASGNFYLGSTSSINFLDNAAHDSHFTNTSGGNFTIQSDQYGTGSIGKIPNNPGTHQNSFDGLFKCERYLNGYRGYRLMASPVYAATSGSNYVYSLNYVQNSSFITGTNAAGGFDKVTNGPTLYLFREDMPLSNASFTSGNFQGISDLNSGLDSPPTYTFNVTTGSYSIPVSNGFLFFFRGNRYSATYTEAQQFTPGTPAEATTLSTTGYLTQQQVVFRDWTTPTSNLLSYSNPSAFVLGWNMAANPYACSIDWNTQQSASTTTGIYALNLAPYIYEYNPRTANYDTYYSNGTYTNNGTRTIMSGQSFFVVALNGSAQLIFNESAKSATLQNTGQSLLMGKPADMLARDQSMRIQIAADTINKDNAFIKFDPGAKITFDPREDARYFGGSGKVSISSMSSDNQQLAVNILPFNSQGQTIRVNIGVKAEGTYSFDATEINGIPKLFDVLLADSDTKDTTDMRNGPYNFNVSWADTNSYGSHRFSIIMRQNPEYAYQLLSFDAQKVPSAREVNVTWNTKYEGDYTNFTVERSIDGGRNFEILGGVPSTGTGNYGFTDKHPAEGFNFYRLKQEDINNKITYSRIVPIHFGNGRNYLTQNWISVYPNPASGRINLAITTPFISSSSSVYNILISNSSGNMLKKITSTEPYWQGDATGWIPGTYMIKVFDAKTQSLIGTTKFIKL